MADRNDFKIIAQTSISYFTSLCNELNIELDGVSENDKARLLSFSFRGHYWRN